MDTTGTIVVPDEVIINKIYFVRDQKVMLDKDLAILVIIYFTYLKSFPRYLATDPNCSSILRS